MLNKISGSLLVAILAFSMLTSSFASALVTANAVNDQLNSSSIADDGSDKTQLSEKQTTQREYQKSATSLAPQIKTPTVIVLNEPVRKIRADEIVLFIGTLNTKADEPVYGAKVWIKYTDARGAQHFLGSSVTDASGKFIIKWVAGIYGGVTSMEVYAEFAGNDDYTNSKSKSFNITIDKQKPSTIVAYTDKKIYELGDYVAISGKVNDITITKLVGIEVLNPEGRSFKMAQAPISDGSFKWQFLLAGQYAVPGKYNMIVNYWHESFKTSFLLDGNGIQDAVKTILSLNPPHMTIQKGDALLFTGSLMASDKTTGIPRAKILISYIDNNNDVRQITSGTTDNEGKFSMKWKSNLDTVGTVRIFALFEGERLFEGAVSQEYTITLASKAKEFVAKTDKQSYNFGEIVKIMGSVPQVSDVPVLIQIFDSQDRVLFTDNIEISTDGSFNYEVLVEEVMTIFGTYSIKISHNEKSKILEVYVTQPEYGTIMVKSTQFVDSINLPVNDLSQDKDVYLKTTVKNNVNMDQSFRCIMQIQDSDKFTVLIRSAEHVIIKGETVTLEMPWVPESKGEFTINIFLLQNSENPLVLSPMPATLHTSVY